MVVTSRSRQIFRFRHSANLACSCGLLICTTTRSLPSILSGKESRMSLINARKNRVHWPKSEVHHSPSQFFVFKTALFISICLQILRENNAKDRIRSWKTYVYITSLMGRKRPLKIQSSSNSVGVQKKLIIIFLRVVNISEKIPRKPVPILREEIRDFKLLRHFKLPNTDSTGPKSSSDCTT